MIMPVSACQGPAGRPRRIPTPQWEPPYEDERPSPAPPPGTPATPTQGALALAFALPSGVPAQPRPPLRLVADSAHALAHPDAVQPAQRRWAHTMALAIGQVLSGERPATQLVPWAAPDILAQLGRRASLAARGPRRRASLRQVQACAPRPGVIEAVTVVHGLPRPRALAFRLEARRHRWVCTALELG